MSAGRGTFVIATALACLLVFAAGGVFLLARSDMRNLAAQHAGLVDAKIRFVGLAGGGTRLRFTLTVEKFMVIPVEWCLWPFREIK